MLYKEWRIARVEEFSEGSRRIFRIDDGREVMVARLNGRWCAVGKHSAEGACKVPVIARQCPSTMLPRYRVRDDGRNVFLLVD